MKQIEKHIIKQNNANWKQFDRLCFISKNIYNVGLYEIRQHYEATKKYIGYNKLEKQVKLNENYQLLPAQSVQQTLMLLDKNYKSFFKSKNKVAKRGLPKYKDKLKGRNVLIFTNQQCKIQDGILKFPKKAMLKPMKTKIEKLQQVRVVPQASCFQVEVVYEKQIENHNLNKNNVVAIDLGINNLCTLVSNKPNLQPLIINGKPLKSMNQYFNKKTSQLKSFAKILNKRSSTKQIERTILKRKCKIDNYMHHASKAVVAYCLNNDIGSIVVGKNDGWKQNCNIGKVNNQKFVMIPFDKLLKQIQYKSKLVGIQYQQIEENYTSKCSALDLETIEHHDEYVGKRICRGLFKTKSGKLINADVNGAYNILRKVFGDDVVKNNIGINTGVGYTPAKLNPILQISQKQHEILVEKG